MAQFEFVTIQHGAGSHRSLSVFSTLQVPRMIVNVVQILPMQTLREVHKPTPGCLLQR